MEKYPQGQLASRLPYYVKVDGEWKYQHLRANIRMSAAYDKGWAK